MGGDEKEYSSKFLTSNSNIQLFSNNVAKKGVKNIAFCFLLKLSADQLFFAYFSKTK